MVAKLKLNMVAKLKLDMVAKLKLNMVAKLKLNMVAKLKLNRVAKLKLNRVAKLKLNMVAIKIRHKEGANKKIKVALWRHLPVLLSCYPGKAEGGALGPPSCPPVSSGKTIELVTCNLNL